MLCQSERRNLLYGPTRETVLKPFKEFMNNSSVFQNDPSLTKDRFETTKSTSFNKKCVKLDRETAKKSTEQQRTSNFKFGSDESYPLITTKNSEFSNNDLPAVKRVVYDFYSTNIPDFSPSCAKRDFLADDDSEYASCYQTPKNCPRVLGKKREHLKSQTEEMRSTHFDLGSEKQRKCSETFHSYNDRNHSDLKGQNEAYVVGPSSVFRNGDWNIKDQGSAYKSSVTHDNFAHVKGHENYPAKYDDYRKLRFETDDYQGRRGTNFKLGSNKHIISSLYKKDFRQLKTLTPNCPLKLLRDVRPKSAKVLNQTSDMLCPISTEQSHFVYRQKEADDLKKKRHQEYKNNQEKDKICSVVLDEDGKNSSTYTKPISMNDKDYQIPSTELLRRHKIYRRPSPEYDYILLDKNSKSLNKQSVKAADENINLVQVEIKKQRLDKIISRDDHRTHFTFGSDTQRYPNSEQHDQFVQKAPMDPGYPSAGKSSKSREITRSDISPTTIPHLSVMRGDYQSAARHSPSQRRLVNLSLKHPIIIAPSHYFHMDHDRGKRISTTATDYTPPETMALSDKI